MARTYTRSRLFYAALAFSLAATLGGCQGLKNIFDYVNLRNSFLDPSQVGRFDKASPWGVLGPAKPVTWPILEQLDVIDEPSLHWTNATDPLPSDIVSDTREYVVGEGDIIRVSVFELVTPGMEFIKEVQVDELGNIVLQNVESVHVADLTPTEASEKIGQIAVEKGFLLAKGNGSPGPQVSVSLLQSRARIFSVIGMATAPGSYNIIGTDFKLLDALALARDVIGGSQPGMDYLYVMRPQKGAGVVPATRPAKANGTNNTGPSNVNPLETIESLEHGAPTPPPLSPLSPPTTVPSSQGTEGPRFLRPLPTAMVASADNPTQLAQADLDAALGGMKPDAPATSPATVPTPVAELPPLPSTLPATPPVVTPPAADSALLNQAVGGANERPGFIFVDGKWVAVPGAAGDKASTMTPAESLAAATGLSNPRVIRIPIDALREFNPKYNIVIRPGDVIHIPNIPQGEFYMMGHVNHPGVYLLTGRKVTLKQAVAAAAGLDAVAIPRRCDLIRRIGPNQEVTVQVDLQRVFDGEQPDIFLKANDVVNVGTDMIAPFLAVTRNAYRASYGWGMVYDRNLYSQVNLTKAVP